MGCKSSVTNYEKVCLQDASSFNQDIGKLLGTQLMLLDMFQVRFKHATNI